MKKFVQTNLENKIATICLNRPEAHNALNETVIQELTQAFQEAGSRSDARAVVFASKGTSFCAGGDIAWMKQAAAFSQEENLVDAGRLAAMFRAIRECPKPVIARVHGAAFGGGVGLVAAADVAVAVESAVFCFSEVRLGIMPAVIVPWVLEKTGPGPLFRYMMTAEKFSAPEAKHIGLVSEVVASIDALDKKIQAVCDEIKKGGPEAMKACKRLLQDLSDGRLEQELALTTRRIAEIRVSPEGQEGLSAFLEKRPPKWLD